MMSDKLRDKIVTLERLIGIQTDSLESGYMHGMLNGLIVAHSVIANQSPDFVSLPKPKTHIRHKSRKR
jgi:hypothetical protein